MKSPWAGDVDKFILPAIEDQLTVQLGDSWRMFFSSKMPISDLRPVQTLSVCISITNQKLATLGRKISQWPAHDQNNAARLLRVNWIYNRLGQEPIRKPVLCYWKDDSYNVICGDTRLMCLSLCDTPQTISVLILADQSNSDLFSHLRSISTSRDLLSATGFPFDTKILCHGSKYQGLDWLEIASESTSHHLHDTKQRVSLLENYLETQNNNFCFSDWWCRQPIEWSLYQARI